MAGIGTIDRVDNAPTQPKTNINVTVTEDNTAPVGNYTANSETEDNTAPVGNYTANSETNNNTPAEKPDAEKAAKKALEHGLTQDSWDVYMKDLGIDKQGLTFKEFACVCGYPGAENLTTQQVETGLRNLAGYVTGDGTGISSSDCKAAHAVGEHSKQFWTASFYVQVAGRAAIKVEKQDDNDKLAKQMIDQMVASLKAMGITDAELDLFMNGGANEKYGGSYEGYQKYINSTLGTKYNYNP